MAKKVIHLSVHKNTVERRRKNDLAKTLGHSVQQMIKAHDLRAYAIVGIDSEGKAYAMWDTGAIMPIWGFADTVSAILSRDIEDSGAEEDWKPPLNK